MNDCIEHKGYKNKDGYGRVSYKGKATGAHRKAWILANGDIPVGMNILHRCDNPACVKIEHLFLGTQQENIEDMIKKGRKWAGIVIRKSDGYPANAKLTKEQIKEVIRLRGKGITQQSIANKFNVSQGCISQILLGRTQYAK